MRNTGTGPYVMKQSVFLVEKIPHILLRHRTQTHPVRLTFSLDGFLTLQKINKHQPAISGYAGVK
jgi:hypothetical protein